MGTWGTALYSDDLAADLRTEYRDLIGQGLTADAALARLMSEYQSVLADPDEMPVFWLAIADVGWRLGHPASRATTEALRVIDSGVDLKRWQDPNAQQKRERVLEKLAFTLRSTPPAAKRVAKPVIADNPWSVGQLIAFRLQSGKWTLFRVIGHHVDKGGRSAICEPLDWVGATPPDTMPGTAIRVRSSVEQWKVSQFLLGEPRRKQDLARIVPINAILPPSQQPGRFSVFAFPHIDRQMEDIFGLK